jgi:ornithine--oxo-acid transaminase
LKNPVIREVRGKGLWIGIELTVPARPYCERLKESGVLCKETHERVIRIAPPLVITQKEIDWACERFQQVFQKD